MPECPRQQYASPDPFRRRHQSTANHVGSPMRVEDSAIVPAGETLRSPYQAGLAIPRGKATMEPFEDRKIEEHAKVGG